MTGRRRAGTSRPDPRPLQTSAAPAGQIIAAPPVASDPNSPIGEWITERRRGPGANHPCGQALCGIVAGGNPNDTDRHNPDPAKRNRPMDGMTVLIDMKPAKNNHWEGQIYNPRTARPTPRNFAQERRRASG